MKEYILDRDYFTHPGKYNYCLLFDFFKIQSFTFNTANDSIYPVKNIKT